MQESLKKDFECEQLKGMKSSASKKDGKSQKKMFLFLFCFFISGSIDVKL